MESFQSNASCDGQKGFCGADASDSYEQMNKPIEMYLFIDPLSYNCWSFEPIIKKLVMEYGHYFIVRYVIGGRLESWNAYKKSITTKSHHAHSLPPFSAKISRSGIQCDEKLYHSPKIEPPYLAFIAIKAAELQGKRAGFKYLQKLREHLFLNEVPLTTELIYQCAEEAQLDFEEFKKDIYSKGAHKAFQCDVRFNFEMEVEEYPTIVLFNGNVEEEGIKIPGQYAYEVYTQVMEEMIGQKINKQSLKNLASFVKQFQLVSTKEISKVYNLSPQEVECKMKKMQLQRIVERIESSHGIFWRYIKKRMHKKR